MPDRRFCTSDFRLDFRCDAHRLVDPALEIFSHYGLAPCGDDGAADFGIHLRDSTGPSERPPAAQRLAAHDSGLEIYYLDRARFLERGSSRAMIDLEAAHATIEISETANSGDGHAGANLYLMMVFSLVILLQDTGRYALHAAAVGESEDAGILIVAASDSGKSTMTMHLARQGWKFLSDDSVLLRSGGGLVYATPLRKDFALDADASHLFPEIDRKSRPLLTDPNKRQLAADDIFPNRRFASFVPRILIFPELAPVAQSQLERIGTHAAFLNLLQQAAFLTHDPVAGASQAHVLRDLAAQTSAYRLLAGEDIRTDGRHLARLLRSTVASTS